MTGFSRRGVIAATLALAATAVHPALAQQAAGNEREKLFAALKDARTEAEARRVEEAIWRMWMANAPSIPVRADVERAMQARGDYDYARALEILDGVVDDAPDYAEGWNQRAFVLFLMDRPDASLQDLDRALELEPKHFAALAGKGMILMRQGRAQLGQKVLRQAVEIHPWLRERSMIIPDPENPLPAPGGKDI